MWDLELTSPYTTSWWGDAVSSLFGGTFEVVDLSDALVPALVGGDLAGGGFVCGHIGYGGIFTATGPAYEPSVVRAAIRAAERHLGCRCLRVVLPPLDDPAAPTALAAAWGHRVDVTDIKTLHLGGQLAASYSGNARTQLRRAAGAGITVDVVTIDAIDQVARLVHSTQSRVGAAYRTHTKVLRLFLQGAARFQTFGSWRMGMLLSVGCFVVGHARAAYYLNGWDPGAGALAPNAAMLHFAFSELAEQGIAEVDLGVSHSPGLRRAKQRWNTVPRFFVRLSPGDLLESP